MHFEIIFTTWKLFSLLFKRSQWSYLIVKSMQYLYITNLDRNLDMHKIHTPLIWKKNH
jgi:hypothetical protein